jgi:hypothetical protein
MLPNDSRRASVTAHLAAAVATAVLLAAQAAPLAAQNLLGNPGFQTSLSNWLIVGSHASWDATLDADGNPNSGSANGFFDAPTANGVDGVVAQCVPVTVGTTYHFGGKIFVAEHNSAAGGAFYLLVPFPTADCSGPPPPGPIVETPEVTAVGSWDDSIATFHDSFAKSVLFTAVLAPESGGRLSANFDNAVLALGAAPCVPGPTTLCLSGGRFGVAATFDTGNGAGPSNAQAVPLGKSSGYFWFFDAANVEVLVKLLDGCSLGGHFWFFAAGLTNVNVTITVTDTETGAIQVYVNPAHTAFQPIQDTSAFACP